MARTRGSLGIRKDHKAAKRGFGCDFKGEGRGVERSWQIWCLEEAGVFEFVLACEGYHKWDL